MRLAIGSSFITEAVPMWPRILATLLFANASAAKPLYSADAGQEPIDLPVKVADPDHPAPSWVDALASKPRSSAMKGFEQLSTEHQVEFAVFMWIDQHPGDPEWSLRLAQQGKKLLPLLERMIAREPSDRFALGLMHIVFYVAAKFGLRDESTLYDTMRRRVQRISNPTMKWNGEELIARISREDRSR